MTDVENQPLPIRLCAAAERGQPHPGHRHRARWSRSGGTRPTDGQIVWCPGVDELEAKSGTLDGINADFRNREDDRMTEKYGPTPTSQGVRGYRDLTETEIAEVNENKRMEEDVADRWAQVMGLDGVDKRWMNIAKTHFQEGWSAMTRAITRPHDPFAEALESER